MSPEGYAYTTISARPGQPVRISVSFYLDEQSWIATPGTGTGNAHLLISHGEVSVSIGPRQQGTATAADAQIARSLADKAAAYAAEVERMAAAPDGGSPEVPAA